MKGVDWGGRRNLSNGAAGERPELPFCGGAAPFTGASQCMYEELAEYAVEPVIFF